MPPRCSFSAPLSSARTSVANDGRAGSMRAHPSALSTISEGDCVQTAQGQGNVLKRRGAQLRVQYADRTAWIEIGSVLSVIAGGAAGGVAGSVGPHATATDLFQLLDRDRNGSIDRAEFVAFLLPLVSERSRINEWWTSLVAVHGSGGDEGKARITQASFDRWAQALPAEAIDLMRRKWLPLTADNTPVPRYEPGQRLLVVSTDGTLNDALVGASEEAASGSGDGAPRSAHLADGSTLPLDPRNHCRLRLPSVDAYRAAIASYCADLESRTSVLEDGITGMSLRTQDQLLAIDVSAKGVQSDGVSDAPNIAALQEPLLAGTRDTPPVLVCAEPGTGKTWSAVQLTHALAQRCRQQAASDAGAPLVPVLVFVQRVSRMLEGSDPAKPLDTRTLLQYLAIEHADHDEWLSVLTMALEMRTLVLVLDGIDEAAERRKTISSFVCDVLAPAGVRLVCTSRPEGVRLKDFAAHFVIFNLKPLSDEQQRQALRQQLAGTGGDGGASQSELGAEVRILSSLDDRLIAALLAGFIRLVRSEWLIQQPDEYCIERRQELEERERNGETPTPLLSPEEGAALVRSATRCVGAVS